MRGDSLRDLYAKTLAVLGLGLLAGAGAIVDYWPVNGRLPAIPAVAELVPVRPAQVREVPRIPAPQPLRRATQPAAETPTNTVTPAISITIADVAVPVEMADVAAESPIPADFILVSDEFPAGSSPVILLDFDPAPVSVGPAETVPSFLADALRRTRASIKEARASLRGALTGMVGAFRKVSPFFSTTTTPTTF